MDTPPLTRAGFTITEICVVMVLTAIVAGMLLPAITMVRSENHHARCENNQRQIVLGMNVYANDNDQKWPVFTANCTGRWVPASDSFLDATATAIGSMEMMAFCTGGDIPAKTFACTNQPTVRPSTQAANAGTTSSMSDWALQGPRHIGYSYDWSVPENGSSVRVVLADRDRNAHKGILIKVAFADGHVGNLDRVGTAFINKDAKDDDVYTDVGDGPMNLPSEGSSTRAFVR